jgi:hypothetical protein
MARSGTLEGNLELDSLKKTFVFALPLLLVFPLLAYAQTYEGKIVSGGGVDDMQIAVKVSSSLTVSAYCNRQCGDWFIENEDAVSHLKPKMAGRKVQIVVKREPNDGRIAGPSDDEEFLFIKSVKLMR